MVRCSASKHRPEAVANPTPCGGCDPAGRCTRHPGSTAVELAQQNEVREEAGISDPLEEGIERDNRENEKLHETVRQNRSANMRMHQDLPEFVRGHLTLLTFLRRYGDGLIGPRRGKTRPVL